MNNETLEKEADILVDNDMGGRSEEFISGVRRTLESFEALSKSSTNGCLLTEHIQVFMDHIYDKTQDYY